MMRKPYTWRNKIQGWHKQTMPRMIIHIEMGSKYFALKCLNIRGSLFSDGPKGDSSQQVFPQQESENSHRE